jgi:hypothetical protein
MPTAELLRTWLDPQAREAGAQSGHPAGLIDLDDGFAAEDRSALLAGKALRGVVGECAIVGLTSMSLLPTCSAEGDTLDDGWDF